MIGAREVAVNHDDIARIPGLPQELGVAVGRRISELQALEPYVAPRDVDLAERRHLGAVGLPHDVASSAAAHRERRGTIRSGAQVEDVARLRDGLRGGDAAERVGERAAPSAGARHHVERAAAGRQRRHRPRRHHCGDRLIRTCVHPPRSPRDRDHREHRDQQISDYRHLPRRVPGRQARARLRVRSG
jgi:hypothetical protein